MSRSYKKHPVWTDGSPHTTKEMKRFANKAVRHAGFDEIPLKGKGYKKKFESWDIHDQVTRCTKQQCIDNWERHGCVHNYYYIYNLKDETYEECINGWEKTYHRK